MPDKTFDFFSIEAVPSRATIGIDSTYFKKELTCNLIFESDILFIFTPQKCWCVQLSPQITFLVFPSQIYTQNVNKW